MRNLFLRLFDYIADVISALMNVGVRLKYVLVLLILFTGGAVALTYTKMLNNVGGTEYYNEAMSYVELKDVIEQRFIDEVNRNSMADSSATAIVAGLGDKWSYYMTSDEYKSYQLYSSNEYTDIGMSIIKYSGGGFQVVSVTPGTPAGYSGITSGLIIDSIDDIDITNADIDDVRVLIRSRMNKKFVIGSGDSVYPVDCTITHISGVSSRLEKTEAGYVQIKNFEAGSGEEAIAAIEKLLSQKAVALCIDVRNNSGGLDSEVATLLDYLLPSGELFSQVDREGHKTVTRSDAMSLQMPMVVLVNSGTYCEAELFAAVLQEYGWASLIGEATSGMTRTQETFELSNGSAVRLSTKSYITPKGTDIALSGGVVPTTIIHNSDPTTVGTTDGTYTDSNSNGTAAEDEQLMAALKYLS